MSTKHLEQHDRRTIVDEWVAGVPTKRLADRYLVSEWSITNICKQAGATRPSLRIRHTVNEEFFHEIDTETKAYWLGFIVADGYIGRNQTLQLGLGIKDEGHLRRFRTDIGSHHPIIRQELPNPSVRITIGRKAIVDDLAKLGVSSGKTGTERVPDGLEESLSRHFIRGLFDGDGTWMVMKRPDRPSMAVRFSICSASIGLLEQVRDRLEEGCSLNHNKLQQVGQRRCWQLCYKGRLQCTSIFDFLYRDATVWLQRKRDIISKFLG